MVRNPAKSFALKVQGDSMIEDGIHDEDVILVQKQNTANNGDIVVATVENEATVKRIYFRARPDSGSSDKMVELRPSNSTMKSMWYPPEEVEIRGILVGLLRKF
ncbi:LexA repressor [compost metagenome]